jgi:hypothetical protein
MKIISGEEPLYCEEGEASHTLVHQLGAAADRAELVRQVREWTPLVFDSMVS